MYIWNVKPESDVYNRDNTPFVHVTFNYKNCKCPNCTSQICPNEAGRGDGTLHVYRDFQGVISFTLSIGATRNIYAFLDEESRKQITDYVSARFVLRPVEFAFNVPVRSSDGHWTMNVNFINHTEYSGATIYIRDEKPTGAFDIKKTYPHHLRAYYSMFNDQNVMKNMWRAFVEEGYSL